MVHGRRGGDDLEDTGGGKLAVQAGVAKGIGAVEAGQSQHPPALPFHDDNADIAGVHAIDGVEEVVLQVGVEGGLDMKGAAGGR